MNLTDYRNVFGKGAKEYQRYRSFYIPELFDLLKRIIDARYTTHPVTVLDIGCGTGKSSEPISKLPNTQVTGCDPDGVMIAEAKIAAQEHGLSINYIQAPAELLPFDDSSFDVLTAGTSLHWFATPEAFAEIKRVLKPQGLFFAFWPMYVDNTPVVGKDVFSKYNWQTSPPELRNIEHIKQLFVTNGFIDVTTQTIPYTRHYTLEQYIGGLKTTASYYLLSPQDQEGFVKDMEDAFTREVDGEHFVAQREIRLCYGFKP
jgi:ubiquinone/menaquinone biosynthesis C-methylase UbiE